VVIGPVNDRYVDFGAAEGTGRVKTPEPSANDYNARPPPRRDYFSSTSSVNEPGSIGGRGLGFSVVAAGGVPNSAVTV
jgi:hypothetical protein